MNYLYLLFITILFNANIYGMQVQKNGTNKIDCKSRYCKNVKKFFKKSSSLKKIDKALKPKLNNSDIFELNYLLSKEIAQQLTSILANRLSKGDIDILFIDAIKERCYFLMTLIECSCLVLNYSEALFELISLNKEFTEHDYIWCCRLIKLGANVNYRGALGYSILMELININQINTAKFLIKKGADVNLANYYGFSPLMVAVGKNDIDMIKMLVDNGANISQTCSNGLNCLDLARKQFEPNQEIIDFLESKLKEN